MSRIKVCESVSSLGSWLPPLHMVPPMCVFPDIRPTCHLALSCSWEQSTILGSAALLIKWSGRGGRADFEHLLLCGFLTAFMFACLYTLSTRSRGHRGSWLEPVSKQTVFPHTTGSRPFSPKNIKDAISLDSFRGRWDKNVEKQFTICF